MKSTSISDINKINHNSKMAISYSYKVKVIHLLAIIVKALT